MFFKNVKLWLNTPLGTFYTFRTTISAKMTGHIFYKCIPVLNRHFTSSSFLRCLNQERKDVSDGAGKFRVFVQPFIGPGPFSIFSSFDHGFIAVLAIAALILYAVGVDAHFAKPFINAFSGIGVSFSSSAIISR